MIVTGGGGVLGGAIAKAFAYNGAKVALSYHSSRESADATVSAIEAAGGVAFAEYLDVLDPVSTEGFVSSTAERYGGVDILVNAAGRIDAADAVRFAEIDLEAWDELFLVDVRGTFLMCRAAVPHMHQRGAGVIVNFSGSYGNGVNQDNMVNSVAVQYCAAKGAIRGFTAALARDLSPIVRVNAVAPGPIAANWEADWDIPVEHMQEAIAMTPLKRLGQPEEIAATVLFLASDGAAYITGQVLHVDGGWLLSG